MAWTTIAHLMNVHSYKSNVEVSESMKSYYWYEFNTDTWFINEWWDVGIFCYNEQSLAFGLIAGTDID